MRRLVIAAFIAILAMPLSASHIVSDGSLPEHVLSTLASSVGRETYGRGDLDFSASGYSSDGWDDGWTHSSFYLAYSDKEVLVEFYGRSEDELLESLSDSIRGILFYEDSLSSDADLTLGYALDSSYSTLSETTLRRGTMLRAIDSFGSTRALFEVDDVYGDAMTLQPVYLDSPYPGMALEEAGAWTIGATVASGFDFSSPSILLLATLGRTDLIYPLIPIISLGGMYGPDGLNAYLGLGMEAYLDLSTAFPSVGFTLIQEGRIGGNVSLLIGGGASGFDWRSVFSIFYEHRALAGLSWRIGYQNLQGTHMLLVGMGGMF